PAGIGTTIPPWLAATSGGHPARSSSRSATQDGPRTTSSSRDATHSGTAPLPPVVDHQDPSRDRGGPRGQGLEQAGQAVPPDRRHDDVEGHGRVRAPRRTRNG